MPGSFDEFIHAVGDRESRGNGGYRAENNLGFLGRYQMGEAALVDAGYYEWGSDQTRGGLTTDKNDWKGKWTGKDGVYNKEQYLSNPAAQDNAFKKYLDINTYTIRAKGLGSYAGGSVTVDGKEIAVTESGMLAASHLGGVGGLMELLHSGGKMDKIDKYGTRISEYLEQFADYDVPQKFKPEFTEIPIPKEKPIPRMRPANASDSIGGAFSSIGEGFSDAFGLNESEPETPLRPQILPSRSQQAEDIFRHFGGNLAGGLLSESLDFVFDHVFGGERSHTTRYETDRSRRAGSFPSRQQMHDVLMREYQQALRHR